MKLRSVLREAFTNGELDDAARVSALKKNYPNLSEGQIQAVMRAHNGVDETGSVMNIVDDITNKSYTVSCPIGMCNKFQIQAKIDEMRKVGIPEADIKDILRKGFAGKKNPNTNLAEDGFFSVRNYGMDDVAKAYKYSIAANHPNAKIVETLQSLPSSASDQVRLQIQRLNPDDPNLVIRSIDIPSSRVVNGDVITGGDAGFRALYETNPQRTLASSEGRTVKINYLDEDGDDFEVIGKIVKGDDGKYQIASENRYAHGLNSQHYYTPIEEIQNITTIQRTYPRGRWRGDNVKEFGDELIEGAKVKVSFQKPTGYSGSTEATELEGVFLGITKHTFVVGKEEPAMALRKANGNVEYVPINGQTQMSTEGGSILDYKGSGPNP